MPTATNRTFQYGVTRLRDMRVIPQPKTGRPLVEIEGRQLFPSDRFWTSFHRQFKLSEQVFRYFSYDEVFARVVEKLPSDRLRYCLELGRPDRPGRALAVTDPKRPCLDFDTAHSLIESHGAENLEYYDGVLTSRHTPPSGERDVRIGPDSFQHRLQLEAPIDGHGQPRMYLSLLRMVCSNGMVGYTRAFRSDVRMGDDVAYTLGRALKQFDSDQGFAALRQRFDSAQKSWASLREVRELDKTLVKSGVRAGAQSRLRELAGDAHALYGVTNLDAISAKSQRLLPVQCRVYDLLNFASELSTHHTAAQARVRLQAYLGAMVADEYDLEGTAEQVPEFNDLFMPQRN